MGLHPLIANRLMHVHTWGMHTKCGCGGGEWLRLAHWHGPGRQGFYYSTVSSRYQHALSASSH